jgi:hypothetical protein
MTDDNVYILADRRKGQEIVQVDTGMRDVGDMLKELLEAMEKLEMPSLLAVYNDWNVRIEKKK